ncbi:uncharacterized protein LOC133446333 [Cololabis saira]|uniref:uncharacterized protein LOC133446333 n=1 Tax=Cololabis saira TaxID=129043 RepID=UPI002AD5291F|nr:uncharacterized protein LOC133446333 [Cololabis saira]
MHHTRDVDYSTGGTKWSETFRNVVLDVDVLFHETAGLLNCRGNMAAVRQIQDALAQFNNSLSVSSSDRSGFINFLWTMMMSLYSICIALYWFIRTWVAQSSGDAVKVYKVTTGETFGAAEDLQRQLKSELHVTYTNQQDSDVIIVFCPISSRVGSDVDAAMRDVSDDKKIILVLMHHTRDVDYSTAGKKWSEAFLNVVLEVHVLFHESVPGLLMCDKNREAVHQIEHAVAQGYRCGESICGASHQDHSGFFWIIIITGLKVCAWLRKVCAWPRKVCAWLREVCAWLMKCLVRLIR